MKITIFSGNQSRHLNLAKTLSCLCEEIFFISECTTVFPGEVEDLYKKKDKIKKYFLNVKKLKKYIWGN